MTYDAPDPDLPPKVTTWHPDELGWQKVGPYTWEDPKGMRYQFPHGVPPTIVRLEDKFIIRGYDVE